MIKANARDFLINLLLLAWNTRQHILHLYL